MKKLSFSFCIVLMSFCATAQFVGIGTGDPKTQLDVKGGLSLREGPALTLANGGASGGTNDNIVLPDISTGVKAGFYRITGPTAAFSIFGIVPMSGADGQLVTLVNTTSHVMTIKNNASSVAANGFKTLTNSDMVSVAGNSSITIQYNKSESRWYVTASQNYTVNTVAATAPITSTGGTTPTIGITAATSGAAGSMSAADKAKLDAATSGNTGSTLVMRDGSGNFSAGLVSADLNGNWRMLDDRIIEPNAISHGSARFGFGTFDNNNAPPYADYLHLRSYTDASGGSDNLVMFKRNGIGMRIYQQAWNSASPYSSFKDIAFTDGTNATGNWNINTTGYATYLKSPYPYNVNITDATTAQSLCEPGSLSSVNMHSSHGLFGNWATTLTMSGYERYGAYQIAGNYNNSVPELAIRNYVQSSSTWNNWVKVITTANVGSYGDHLGNHTATTTLNLNGNALTNFSRLEPYGVGGNSGQSAHSYGIYQEGGSWSHPYPDLHIGYHTGIKLGAYYGYNGTRFYNNSDMVTQTMSVNDGDNNTRIYYDLSTVGDIHSNQNYGKGLVGIYSDTRYQNVFSMGPAYRLSADGTSSGNLYGLAWTHSNIGGQSRSGLGHQLLVMDNGNTTAAIGQGFWTSYGIQTGSNGTYNKFNTWTDLPGYHGIFSSAYNGAHFYPNNGSYGSWRVDGNRNGWHGIEFAAEGGNLSLMMSHTSYTWGNQYSGVHNNSNGWLWYFIHRSLYASIMYDYDNTGYYIDPACISWLYGFNYYYAYYYSSRELKKDIHKFDNNDYSSALAFMDKLQLNYFRYKNKEVSQDIRVGFIAEETPHALTDSANKAVDVSQLTFLNTAAIKTLKQKVENIETKKNISDFGVEEISGATLWVSFSDEFKEQLNGAQPVVTVTPARVGVMMSVSKITGEGFMAEITPLNQATNFNWIALAKVPATKTGIEPEVSARFATFLESGKTEKKGPPARDLAQPAPKLDLVPEGTNPTPRHNPNPVKEAPAPKADVIIDQRNIDRTTKPADDKLVAPAAPDVPEQEKRK